MPNPLDNSSPPPRSGIGCGVVIAILAGLLTMWFVCAGLCGGVLILYRQQVEASVEEAKASLSAMVQPEPEVDWNDWMVKRELTHFYQTSLDSVMADKTLAEMLGEPLETVSDTDALFRRQTSGAIAAESEEIEFDVAGPKGKAKVAVHSTGGGSEAGIQPAQITVTLDDGRQVNVAPLHRPLPPVR